MASIHDDLVARVGPRENGKPIVIHAFVSYFDCFLKQILVGCEDGGPFGPSLAVYTAMVCSRRFSLSMAGIVRGLSWKAGEVCVVERYLLDGEARLFRWLYSNNGPHAPAS